MKKILISAAGLLLTLPSFSQVTEIEGVTVLEDCYGHRISPDGSKIVGETFGGTAYYDRISGDAYFYNDCDFGRGNIVSNNGWVVGCQMIDDEATRAVVMAEGKYWYPDVFDPRVSSNIHGITPSGSRMCGVIGNSGPGVTYFPYYCDIDANGNISETHILPTPSKDFFNQEPQYCSAVWISEDGNTIAGQVIDARGVFVYPIVYKCDASGEWSYVLPSESLFNPLNLPLPAPLGEMDEEFPDAPFPDLEKFMTPDEYEAFMEAVDIWQRTGLNQEESPYNFLYLYMSMEKYQEYIEAEDKYYEALAEYSDMMDNYWLELYKVADTSVFFVRNAMALSADGTKLASSAQVDEAVGGNNYIGYYVPYLIDIETGKGSRIGGKRSNMVTTQVFNDGRVIANTLPGNIPASSYLYSPETEEFESFLDYVSEMNPAYGDWMQENLTGEAALSENPDGSYTFQTVTVAGLVSVSNDFEVISGGVDGYNIGKEMYFTYILENLSAGVEEVVIESPEDGVYRVYNLQGVKVMETKDSDNLSNLQRGIYVVNGKKLLLGD